jgi:peptidoglycan/LPS O-acetylase OafA/YrhL
MGILRVYLALCVIADHAGPVFPWKMHDGRQAVQMFYVISGFYMALVLSTRYDKAREFYVSRFLRIFPPYWIVLLGTVVISVGSGLLFDRWLLLRAYISHPLDHNGAGGLFVAALSNVTLLGQDWIMFLQHDVGQSLHFTANFWNDNNPLWHYLVIPQSWSIGVELTFYACAPFLNRLRSGWLISIALVAMVARLCAYRFLGLAHDPWDYRFFPFELSLFLFGMLAYRLYMRILPRLPSQKGRSVSSLSYIIGAASLLLLMYLDLRLVGYFGNLIGPEYAMLITYPLMILLIPVLFFAFGNHKFDRLIGELSYPMYLVHYMVIVLVATLLASLKTDKGLGISSAVASLAVAALFYWTFIVRLDRKRHRMTVSASAK